MALLLGALRLLLGAFFTLAGAAKLLQVSAPVSQQMVSGAAGARGDGRFPRAACFRARGRLGRPLFSASSLGGRGRDLHLVPNWRNDGTQGVQEGEVGR